MRKTLFILTIIIMPLLLLACREDHVDNNNLIQNPISIQDVSQIDIELINHKKSFIDDNNIKLVVDYLKNIQILDERVAGINVNEDEPIRIKIYDRNKGIMEAITIGRGMVNYNKSWHPIDPKIYDEVAEFYGTLDFEAVENQLIIDIKEGVANRIELPLEESLQGTWLSIDGSSIMFQDDILTQGDQTKYSFDYEINRVDDNELNITVYGEDGLFLGGRELSTIEITLDSTKSLMKMKRIMVGGRTYEDKLIYVDEDGLELGFFDSYFFYEGF